MNLNSLTPVPLPENLKPGDKYATHEGFLEFGALKIKVLVLNTGERVIQEEDVVKFMNALEDTTP